jgi:hypothetical protein
MDAATITALQTGFLDGIDDLKAPGLAIMLGGLGITLMVAGFKFMRNRTKEATSGN